MSLEETVRGYCGVKGENEVNVLAEVKSRIISNISDRAAMNDCFFNGLEKYLKSTWIIGVEL